MSTNEEGTFHETLGRRPQVAAGSNRAFGMVMAAACFIIAGFGYISGTSYWFVWSAGFLVFVLTTWLQPALLSPLNQFWFRLGLLMHRVVNPVVMGLLFFVVITPAGFLLRACGKNVLELKFQRAARSYWIPRNERGSQQDSMTTQY